MAAISCIGRTPNIVSRLRPPPPPPTSLLHGTSAWCAGGGSHRPADGGCSSHCSVRGAGSQSLLPSAGASSAHRANTPGCTSGCTYTRGQRVAPCQHAAVHAERMAYGNEQCLGGKANSPASKLREASTCPSAGWGRTQRHTPATVGSRPEPAAETATVVVLTEQPRDPPRACEVRRRVPPPRPATTRAAACQETTKHPNPSAHYASG
jgi:hypothetical protein